MMGALSSLLDDQGLRVRMAAIGEEIRARNGTELGADVIERVARDYANNH